MQYNHMTIGHLLSYTHRRIDRIDAELIMAHITKRPRTYIITHHDARVDIIQYIRFVYTTWQRTRGVPLAYIIGSKEFYGKNFIASKHTLIPRPETELLVEHARVLLTQHAENTLLIDIGTGSGCIPIAILTSLKTNDIECYATDISKQALAIAKKNAQTHNADINFLHGNLLTPVLKHIQQNPPNNQHLLITANLPYLTEAQYAEEPSIQHEPKRALIAENHGLGLYYEMFAELIPLARTHPITVLCEIDPSQSELLYTHLHHTFPHATLTIHRDGMNQDRMIKLNSIPKTKPKF